jgi:hypothetical protein
MMKQVILGEVLLDASFGLAEWESLVLDAFHRSKRIVV